MTRGIQQNAHKELPDSDSTTTTTTTTNCSSSNNFESDYDGFGTATALLRMMRGPFLLMMGAVLLAPLIAVLVPRVGGGGGGNDAAGGGGTSTAAFENSSAIQWRAAASWTLEVGASALIALLGLVLLVGDVSDFCLKRLRRYIRTRTDAFVLEDCLTSLVKVDVGDEDGAEETEGADGGYPLLGLRRCAMGAGLGCVGAAAASCGWLSFLIPKDPELRVQLIQYALDLNEDEARRLLYHPGGLKILLPIAVNSWLESPKSSFEDDENENGESSAAAPDGSSALPPQGQDDSAVAAVDPYDNEDGVCWEGRVRVDDSNSVVYVSHRCASEDADEGGGDSVSDEDDDDEVPSLYDHPLTRAMLGMNGVGVGCGSPPSTREIAGNRDEPPTSPSETKLPIVASPAALADGKESVTYRNSTPVCSSGTSSSTTSSSSASSANEQGLTDFEMLLLNGHDRNGEGNGHGDSAFIIEHRHSSATSFHTASSTATEPTSNVSPGEKEQEARVTRVRTSLPTAATPETQSASDEDKAPSGSVETARADDTATITTTPISIQPPQSAVQPAASTRGSNNRRPAPAGPPTLNTLIQNVARKKMAGWFDAIDDETWEHAQVACSVSAACLVMQLSTSRRARQVAWTAVNASATLTALAVCTSTMTALLARQELTAIQSRPSTLGRDVSGGEGGFASLLMSRIGRTITLRRIATLFRQCFQTTLDQILSNYGPLAKREVAELQLFPREWMEWSFGKGINIRKKIQAVAAAVVLAYFYRRRKQLLLRFRQNKNKTRIATTAMSIGSKLEK